MDCEGIYDREEYIIINGIMSDGVTDSRMDGVSLVRLWGD